MRCTPIIALAAVLLLASSVAVHAQMHSYAPAQPAVAPVGQVAGSGASTQSQPAAFMPSHAGDSAAAAAVAMEQQLAMQASLLAAARSRALEAAYEEYLTRQQHPISGTAGGTLVEGEQLSSSAASDQQRGDQGGRVPLDRRDGRRREQQQPPKSDSPLKPDSKSSPAAAPAAESEWRARCAQRCEERNMDVTGVGVQAVATDKAEVRATVEHRELVNTTSTGGTLPKEEMAALTARVQREVSTRLANVVEYLRSDPVVSKAVTKLRTSGPKADSHVRA